jgi:hypothetical protein
VIIRSGLLAILLEQRSCGMRPIMAVYVMCEQRLQQEGLDKSSEIPCGAPSILQFPDFQQLLASIHPTR